MAKFLNMLKYFVQEGCFPCLSVEWGHYSMKFSCVQGNYCTLLISYEKYLCWQWLRAIIIRNILEVLQKLLKLVRGSIFSWLKLEWEVQLPCCCFSFGFAESVNFSWVFFLLFLNNLSTYLTGMLWGSIVCASV